MRNPGILFCVLAAAAFGGLSTLATLAAHEGVPLLTLLPVRFGIAAIALWPLAARHAAPAARDVLRAVLLGAGLFGLQAALFLGAVQRIDAPLAGLLLATYPALVALGAIALRRDRFRLRTLIALGAGADRTLVALGGRRRGPARPDRPRAGARRGGRLRRLRAGRRRHHAPAGAAAARRAGVRRRGDRARRRRRRHRPADHRHLAARRAARGGARGRLDRAPARRVPVRRPAARRHPRLDRDDARAGRHRRHRRVHARHRRDAPQIVGGALVVAGAIVAQRRSRPAKPASAA